MTKKRRQKPLQRDAFSVLARSIGRYLKQQGWNVLVVGSPRIQQEPSAAPFNYEFVVRFTGGNPKR